ncbi:MAG: PepSY domain-containing protein [Erysipelotrichaceae bacterium]|nr:PepSY domain-containing protein [Erysipelotrichaceae bacterium]MDO5085680.1 PepSY domain-containing protein [Erysipelotrichaceae bacterium]
MKKFILSGVIATAAVAVLAGSTIYAHKTNSTYPTQITTTLTAQDASNIALKQANGGKVVRVEFEYEHNVAKYEVKVINGNTEFEFDIDANTGAILKNEQETKFVKPTQPAVKPTQPTKPTQPVKPTQPTKPQVKPQPVQPTQPAPAATQLTWEQAKAVITNNFNNARITSMDLDYEHGVLVYDVDVIENNVKKDVKIDAHTGAILQNHIDDDHYDVDDQYDDYYDDDRFEVDYDDDRYDDWDDQWDDDDDDDDRYDD